MNISGYNSQSLLQPKSADETQGTRIQPVIPVHRISQSSDVADQAQEPDDFTFEDVFDTVVDAINPFQHLPGVSTAYQAATDDTMNPVSSMAGGFLFGGPLGLMAGAANSFLEMITGKGIGDHAMSLFNSSDPAVQTTKSHAYNPGDGSTFDVSNQGIGLQQYQQFANAQSDLKLGTGASQPQVSFASNMWTAQTLKQAASAYETQHVQNNADQNRLDGVF